MKSEYIVRRQTPVTKVNCQEVVDIFAEAVARAGPSGYVRKTVGAEVLGTTACPCAQEIMKEQVRQELAKAGLSSEVASDLRSGCPLLRITSAAEAASPLRFTTGAAFPSTGSSRSLKSP